MEQKAVSQNDITPRSSNDRSQAIAEFIQQQVTKIDQSVAKQRNERYFKQHIAKAISEEKYGLAIVLLMEHMDFRQKIFWHVIPPTQLTQKEMLIRDARIAAPPSDKFQPYLIMALNNLRATKALLPPTRYQEIHDYFRLLIRNLYAKALEVKIEDLINDLALFNTVLINNLAAQLSINFDSAKERLCIAKDFVNLEEPSRHIVTLSCQLDKDEKEVFVFQADLALTTLTEKIREEYASCNTRKWYIGLEPWLKELVSLYIPYILKENAILPTQLRTVPLIGLRNSYETINGILSVMPVVTTHVFHSGTIVALGKDNEENKRIGLLHGEQLQQTTKASKLLVLTLNSDINPKGNDKTIVDYSEYIANSLRFFHANLPLNAARVISINKYDGINFFLYMAAQEIIPKLKELPAVQDKDKAFLTSLSYYLCNESRSFDKEPCYYDSRSLLAELQTRIIKTAEQESVEEINYLFETIQLGLEICFLSHNNKSLSDVDNRNLTIGCLSNIFLSKLSPLFLCTINSACESGKDRDGILMFRTALISYNRHLFDSYSLITAVPQHQSIIRKNIARLASAWHFQFLAGCQGGTYGAFGIKKDSLGVIPKNEFPPEAAPILIQTSASYNKKILICENKDLIYFPIGNLELKLQCYAIKHALLLQYQRLQAYLFSKDNLTAGQRTSTLLKSKGIQIKRCTLLSEAIAKINALNSSNTLEHLLAIIKGFATEHKKLTDGTYHSLGSTYELHVAIFESLRQVINFANQLENEEEKATHDSRPTYRQ